MKRSILALSAAVLAASAFFSQVQAAAPAGAPAAPGAAAGGPQAPGAPGAPGGRGGRGAGGAGGLGGRAGGRGAIVIGPPAPVPPEVAMMRPSSDEVAQMNAELAKLVAADNSAGGMLLKKYQSLPVIPPSRANTAATFTQTQQRTGARHEGFVARAKEGNIDVLFEGDSITDFWATSGKNAYAKYFGDMKVANFAISGDTTQGVLWGLKNGEGQGFSPKAIMIMIGTNNTGSNTGPEIAEGVGAVVLENRKDFPNAKILLLSIFPRGPGPTDPNRLKNNEANKLIAKLADNQHVFLMDLAPKFLDANGVLLPGTFGGDNLHPAEPGYEIWGAAVKDTLAGWVK